MKNMNLLPVVAVLGLGACAAQVPPDSTMSKIEFEYKFLFYIKNTKPLSMLLVQLSRLTCS